MLTSQELQGLAFLRLKEAEALHAAGLYDGCVYLCGYVVELALKAIVCRTLDVGSYPEDRLVKGLFKTHDFDTLILLAGMRTKLDAARQADPSLNTSWNLVSGWSPDKRYLIAQGEQDASEFLDAIRSPQDGVFTWLRQRW